MEKKPENDIENPENWDYDNPQEKQPVKSPRVVVSVAFQHEDFLTVSQCAERLTKRTSEFIREAALEKAKCRGMEIMVHDFGSTGSLWFERYLPSTTRAYTLINEQETHESVFTN
jgi:hypothetical protein